MTYRELLNLYQAGQLDTKTRKEVESEIEKHEAIGDYLFDAMDSPQIGNTANISGATKKPAECDPLTIQIRKSIRQTFLRLGITTGIVVLSIVLIIMFVLPQAVNYFYYNPNQSISGTLGSETIEQPRINLDLSVWTELFFPSRYRNCAYAESMGYGKYALVFPNTNSPERSGNSVGGMLVRNKLTLFDPNAFNRDHLDFAASITPEDKEQLKEFAFTQAEKTLEDGRQYIACITLNAPTDYKTLYQWCVDRKLTNGLWFNVYTDPIPGLPAWGQAIGFGLDTTSTGSKQLVWDQEKYPNLVEGYGWDFDEEAKKTHFLSLLAYTKDHPEFTEVMGNLHPNYAEVIDHMEKYIKENGLQINGFSFVGTKAEILALQDDPMVPYLVTVPAF